MPSLPDQWITAEAKDGTKFQEKVTCGVTVDGVFTLGIPDDLVELVKDNGVEGGRYFGTSGLRRTIFRDKARLECKSLEEGLKFLRSVALQFITAETTTERVICYRTKIGVAFWIDEKKKFCQNGSYEWTQHGGYWFEPKTSDRFHDNNSELFTVGLGAAVYDKITHKRKSGNKIQWVLVKEETDIDASALNAFRGACADPTTEQTFEMPYTPEAARFFTAALFAICKLAHSIDGFFADKERIQLAINKGAGLLEFPGKK